MQSRPSQERLVLNTDEDVRKAVTNRFTHTAESPHLERVFPVEPDSAKALGYDPNVVEVSRRSSDSRAAQS